MRIKLLTRLQKLQNDLVCDAVDCIAQNANTKAYTTLKDWLAQTSILYALMISTGNNSYIKQCLHMFYLIKPMCENKTHCDGVERQLVAMIEATQE